LNPENSGPAYLGAVALAHLGERERAMDWAARAISIDPADPMVWYNTAAMHSVLGNLDEAVNLLEKALLHASSEQFLWFKNDPDLDAIRSHPGYPRLLDKVQKGSFAVQ
jgi:adenylate cyclase